MTDQAEYALGTTPDVVQLDLIEVSHPDFSQTYRLCRNCELDGVTVTHEGGGGPFLYEYCPMSVMPLENKRDLEQAIAIQLGDVGEIIAAEIARVWEANGMDTRPALVYRTYLSSDLSVPMDESPTVLEIVEVVTTPEGAAFQAQAPQVNDSRTGEYYEPERFPTLRGFV